MPLVPAKIIGPISPLSGSVQAEHVLPDAVVGIMVNGTAINRTQTTTSNVVEIPLAGYSLQPNDVVTVVWSLLGETSKPSLPESVLSYPRDLPAPVFLSSVHTAVDWLTIGGLYPGATVEVLAGNNTVIGGPDTASFAALQLDIRNSVSAGDVLQAVQTVMVPGVGPVVSTRGTSLPVEPRFLREEPLNQPVIIGPIHECAGAVLVGGAVPGCFVELRTGGDSFEYRAVGETFWALLPKAAHAPASFEAVALLRRLGRQSIASVPVTVDPSQSLETPMLAPAIQYCPLTVSLTASHMSPGTEISFEMRGAAGTTALGRAGAPTDSTSATYYLGDLSPLVPTVPPYPSIVLVERACSLSAESNAVHVWQPSSLQEVPPGFFTPPVACAWWLNVLNVGGCVITVHSDAVDWPVLAYWKMTDMEGWLPLNRSLRAGEHVWVTIESGCVPENLRKSDRVKVQDHGDLNALRLDEPIRPGLNRRVWISGTVPGARVHVFVNDVLRTSVWATGPISSTLLEVIVGNLAGGKRDEPGDKVKVCQEMCGEISEFSPAVSAQMGEMSLEISPDFVVRGQSSPVTIHARDAATGTIFLYTGGVSPVYGPSGFVGYTNQPFTVTASGGSATPIRFTVTAEGYTSGFVDLPIHEPAPPPPATLSIKSQSAIGVQNQVIKEIEWTLIGGNQKFVGSGKPNTTSCLVSVALPTPPGGGQVNYALSGKATIEFIHPQTLENMSRTVSVFNTAYGYLGSITVQNWTGSPRTMEINIGWAPVVNPQTGEQTGEVFYFILN